MAAGLLAACQSVPYQPNPTLQHIKPDEGYRLRLALEESAKDGDLVLLMFSGGGSRAAGLGYGVLETLQQTTFGKGNLLQAVDVVYGVSGGSVLAAYFALHGERTIPEFRQQFLEQDFEKQVIQELFLSLPRLGSSEFGRGDLLQEQLNRSLFHHQTFAQLQGKRPFALISATDMNAGVKVDFSQEFFDILCLDLSALEIARAVAASSAVPLVFAPLTLNNHGGQCSQKSAEALVQSALPLEEISSPEGLKSKNRDDLQKRIEHYQDAKKRPFIHLVDGGLTDNLGLSMLLDIHDLSSQEELQERLQQWGVKRVVVINVNAQNEVTSQIDKTAAIPSTSDVVNAIINIPIDKNSDVALRRFREFTDAWNESMTSKPQHQKIPLHFISLRLKDLPEETPAQSALKDAVLNISTSFYLPPEQIQQLQQAASILLKQHQGFQELISQPSH